MFIVTKFMVFFLIFAILIVLREALSFFIELLRPDGHYTPGTKRMVLAGIAISYIFTIIFTGFRIL